MKEKNYKEYIAQIDLCAVSKQAKAELQRIRDENAPYLPKDYEGLEAAFEAAQPKHIGRAIRRVGVSDLSEIFGRILPQYLHNMYNRWVDESLCYIPEIKIVSRQNASETVAVQEAETMTRELRSWIKIICIDDFVVQTQPAPPHIQLEFQL